MACRVSGVKSSIEKDAKLIEDLGGPATVARLLGFPDETGTQRVHNWTKRGIPVRVKYEHPDVFVREGASIPIFPTPVVKDRRKHDQRLGERRNPDLFVPPESKEGEEAA